MDYRQTKPTGRNTKKEPKKPWSYQQRKHRMGIRNPHASISTIKANALNSPINRHRVAVWIKSKFQRMLPSGNASKLQGQK